MSKTKRIDMSNFLDELEFNREKRIQAESIDDYSTEWDEYISDYK